MADLEDNLRRLFVEKLGWDRFSQTLEIPFFEPGQQSRGWASREEKQRQVMFRRHHFILSGVAHKRGLAVFLCSPYKDGQIPNYLMRCDIHRRLRKSAHHHIIIFTQGDSTEQIWQWAHHPEDSDVELCEHCFDWNAIQNNIPFQINQIRFRFEEEGTLTLSEAWRRVHSAFYFNRFKKELWRARLDQLDLSEYGEGVANWIQMAYATRGLPRSEEMRLALLAQCGDVQAAERLIEAHLYIPLEMAWKLLHKRQLVGFELEDLIMEGYQGLRESVRTFEPNLQKRFQTHASFWVRNLMDRAILGHFRLIHIPAYISERWGAYKHDIEMVGDALTQRLQREPQLYEIAEALGLPESVLSKFEIVNITYSSLESLEEEEECEIRFSQPSIDVNEVVEHIFAKGVIQTLRTRLTPREDAVIMLRHGDGELSRGEVGICLSASSERIRQIETSAMGKFRHYYRVLYKSVESPE